MKVKQATYWEAQEQKWYEHYLRSEGVVSKMEDALRKIAEINNKRDRYSDEIDRIVLEALGETNV